MLPRIRLRLVALVATCGAAALSMTPTAVHSAPNPAPTAFAGTPIKHVVILLQENHSFDNVLGPFCVAQLPSPRCDGAVTGRLSDGAVVPLQQASDIVPQVNHAVHAQQIAIDGGAMDGFSQLAGCGVPNLYCYTAFQPSQIPNLTNLAGRFALSDRTFEENIVPSFGAHLELVAQTLDGFTGDNPPSATSASARLGWGCDSKKDAPYQPAGGSLVNEPSCVPDPALNPTTHPNGGAYRQTPVKHVSTIMDRLDAAHRTWKLYTGGGGSDLSYLWAICPTFADCLYTGQARNMVKTSQFTRDASAGTLPSFSVLLPGGGPTADTSQHNGLSMTVGDNWIGQAVAAVENGPDWKSTAIFIAYDDCGCFYDHVAPPANLGIRIPMVIVSPFARPGFTDSTVASFSSMMAFTEHTFGLPPLTSADRTAYDYSNSFNYAQTPLTPIAMVQRPLAPGEAAALAAHPPAPDST